MYALPHTGVGAVLLAVAALAIAGTGAVLRWIGRQK